MIRVMTECKMTQSALAVALVLTSHSSSRLDGVPRFGPSKTGPNVPNSPALSALVVLAEHKR